MFLGADLSSLKAPRQRGDAVLDIVAEHPSTARLCLHQARPGVSSATRAAAGGDCPRAANLGWHNLHHPQRRSPHWCCGRSCIEQGDRYWSHREPPNCAGLTSGSSHSSAPPTPMCGRSIWRTPRSRPWAMASMCGRRRKAAPTPTHIGSPPDPVNLYNWNLMLLILRLPQFTTTLASQTPKSASASAAGPGAILGMAAWWATVCGPPP